MRQVVPAVKRKERVKASPARRNSVRTGTKAAVQKKKAFDYIYRKRKQNGSYQCVA